MKMTAIKGILLLIAIIAVAVGIIYSYQIYERGLVKEKKVLSTYVEGMGFNTYTPQSVIDKISEKLTRKKTLTYDEKLFMDKNLADLLYLRAAIFTEDTNESIDLYKRCIDINNRHKALSPYNYQIYLNLAETYSKEDREYVAITTFNKAIAIFPGKADAYAYKADHYYRNADYGKAEELYKRAIELDGNNQKAHYSLGKLYYGQQRYPEAKFYFNRIIFINPEYSNAYAALGMVYFDGYEDHEKAKECYKKALAISPKNALAKGLLGSLKGVSEGKNGMQK